MELRAPDIETSTPRLVLEAPAALRRVRHIVGVGMGLPRHDGEVEGVVMEDDAVLVLSVCGQRPSVGVAKVTAWAHRSAQSAPEKTRRGVRCERASRRRKLFAHIGLKAINYLADERHGRAYTDYKFIRGILSPSSDVSYSLLPRHAPQSLGPFSQPALRTVDDLLGHFSRLRLRGFRDQPHSRHPGSYHSRNAPRRRPSWCGDDSIGPAHQLCGGSRAFHQQNRGSARVAGH